MLVDRNYVKLELPAFFSHHFRVNLLAEPPAVNLKQSCFYFYELGLKLSHLLRDVTIADMLQKTLRARFQAIIARDAVRRNNNYNEFTAKLANVEDLCKTN